MFILCACISRLKILQNIGSVFVRMGQYADAITSFEHIMGEQPDFKTGGNISSMCVCVFPHFKIFYYINTVIPEINAVFY